ncbi:hypothetical protein C7U73_25860 [Escherichia coli]|nr:hypothetical protein [Escherichia coli]PSX80517.1 hypothetical protein C7U70_26170 [Escherichia coli]PSX98635.1 hypothetical protein C7U69_25455 [Escherichia coli]PSY04526.1 hypothetical protein C7U74_25570 [Escherichia coli]PSY10969.1 hypothetical protein C7U81_25430 [Escherichia coli]
MIWQPEFTDKTLSRKPGAVQSFPPEKDRHTDGNVSKIHSMRAIAARKTFSPVRIFSVKSVSLIFLALCRIILFIHSGKLH